jgi:UDP-N-acetyl-2-amino-2-deoxyglucuronate dehydrogenase
VVTGDRLTHWDVQDNFGEPAPIVREVSSGASDPMAISIVPFESLFLGFAEACRTGKTPLSDGEEGYRALQLVSSNYDWCRSRSPVEIAEEF